MKKLIFILAVVLLVQFFCAVEKLRYANSSPGHLNFREEAEADKNISAYFAYRSSHSLLLSRRILSTLFAWSCNFLTSIITLQFL